MSLFLSVPIFFVGVILCVFILIITLRMLVSAHLDDFVFGLIGICFFAVFVYFTCNVGIAIYTGDYSTINKAIGD